MLRLAAVAAGASCVAWRARGGAHAPPSPERHRDAELAGLVAEIGGDARTRKRDDTDRHSVQQLIVALERRGLVVPVPIGPEGDLRNFAGVGPAGRDAFGTGRRAAMQKNHVGVLGMHLVESGPDAVVIVAVRTAGEGDARTGRKQDLRFAAPLGVDEIAAVDDGSCHGAAIDHRAGVRPPDRTGDLLVAVCCGVAEGFNAIAAVKENFAVGEQALEFDRTDFRTILFALAAFLRVLVVVEFALDAVDGAMESVDHRPEQVVQVRFEARISECAGECVEDIGDGASDLVAVGRGPRVGLVVERLVPEELKLSEHLVGGRRCVLGLVIVVARHGCLLVRRDRAPRAAFGDPSARSGVGRNRRPHLRPAAEGQEGAAILSGDAKARQRRRKIAAPDCCRPTPLLAGSPLEKAACACLVRSGDRLP